MLYNRVLIVILLWATSCSSFQLKSRIQIINKFQTNSKSHNVLMTSAPSILSLDKVVIPYYWDRTRVLSKFGLFLAVTWIISVILKPKIDYEFVLNFLEEKKQIANTVMTKLLAKTDDIVSFVRNRFTNLDLSSWRQFSLKKVVPINSSYSLCQFSAGLFGRLENVDIGQEFQACFLDDNGKVALGKLFPFNYAGKSGQFSCIIKTDSNPSSDGFEDALLSLSVGDEIAVKAGKRHLGVAAKNCDPIRNINLFACSMGIAPALQMTQYFSRDSSLIDSVDLLWINKEKDGFVCDDEIQDLDNKLGDKLKVSRFINAYLDDISVFESDDFMSTIPSYEYGRITVLCGPSIFVDVMRRIAQRKGFAPENILTIQTN